MLKCLDLPRIFNAAKKRGYSTCELLAEASQEVTVHGFARIEEVRLVAEKRIVMHLGNETKATVLSTTDVSTDGCLLLLGEEVTTPTKATDAPALPKILENELAPLRQIVKDIWNAAATLEKGRYQFGSRKRKFWVAREDGFTDDGQDERAHFEARWFTREKEIIREWEVSHFGHQIEDVLAQLKKSDRLKSELAMAANPKTPWPIPSGKFPVVWSPNCVTKLLSLFLRAQHDENFKPNFQFSLSESVRPAKALELVPPRPCESFPPADWGISVTEIETRNFDPHTATLSLTLARARLVHQSQEGEYVTPVTFDVNLLDVLSSFRSFTGAKVTQGYQSPKSASVTTISAPAAISPEFSVPGEVPLQHYW